MDAHIKMQIGLDEISREELKKLVKKFKNKEKKKKEH